MPRVNPKTIQNNTEKRSLDDYFSEAQAYLRKRYDDPQGMKQKREYESLIPIVAMMMQNEKNR